MDGIPKLMETSPGITIPNFSEEPLGTEGEMTIGPNDVNPYNSERERREIEELLRQKREREQSELIKTVRAFGPMETGLRGDDPFGVDTVEDTVDDVRLPFASSQINMDDRLFEW